MVKREWCVYQNWSQIFLGFLAFVQLVRLSGFSSLSPQLSSSSSLLCRLLFLLFFCRQVSFLSYRRDQSKGLPLLQRYSEAEKKEWFHVCMAFFRGRNKYVSIFENLTPLSLFIFLNVKSCSYRLDRFLRRHKNHPHHMMN